MEKKTRNGAVLYIRVSTEEQADPANLGNQEQRCRDYCKRHGLNVVEVFVDAGESAPDSRTAQYQRMLAFCREHRRKVGYVVVQDLSRFARDSGDQANGIVELKRSQILLRSVYEPNVDETAAGRLAANMLGAFNQYFLMLSQRRCAIGRVRQFSQVASVESAHRIHKHWSEGWAEYQA